jgi:cytochrome c oxidase subunit 5b
MWYTEVQNESDLLPPGAATGGVPTDMEQATGLERLEILGKMQGVDIFDMKPLDSSRRGTPLYLYPFPEWLSGGRDC